MLIKALKHWV